MNAILATYYRPVPTSSNEPAVVQPQKSAPVGSISADDDWEQDYLVEVALAEQRERIFSTSYLPSAPARFLIH